jgi:hypothetical protein
MERHKVKEFSSVILFLMKKYMYNSKEEHKFFLCVKVYWHGFILKFNTRIATT